MNTHKGMRADMPHLAADLAKLLGTVAERDDLRGAHKREVLGVEEQDNPLALEAGQLQTAADTSTPPTSQHASLQKKLRYLTSHLEISPSITAGAEKSGAG